MNKVGMMSENVSLYLNMKKSIKLIKDMGYECCDITLLKTDNYRKLNPYFKSKKYINKSLELKKYADSINLSLVQAHAPFPVIKIGDDKYNKKMFNTLIRCIEICGVMKIKNLVIHPFNDYSDIENIEFFNRLIPYAKENDVVICCENMWRWNKEINKARPCACSLSDSFIKTVDGVNSPYLKACLDIGHAEMFSHMGVNPSIMIKEMNDRIVCLHIHDNDGVHDSHMMPKSGVVNFNDVFKSLKETKYNGDYIIETRLPFKRGSLMKAKEFWIKQKDVLLDIINNIN